MVFISILRSPLHPMETHQVVVDARGTVLQLPSTHPIFTVERGSGRLYFQQKYHPERIQIDVEPTILHRMIDLAAARMEAEVNPAIQTCLPLMEQQFISNPWWTYAAEKAQFPIMDATSNCFGSPPTMEELAEFFPQFSCRNHPWSTVDRTVILAHWCCRRHKTINVEPPQTEKDRIVICCDSKSVTVQLTRRSVGWDHKSEDVPLTIESIVDRLAQELGKHDGVFDDYINALIDALTFDQDKID